MPRSTYNIFENKSKQGAGRFGMDVGRRGYPDVI